MWELFPKQKEILERITDPFRSWTPRLGARLPDLHARFERAMFWRRFRRVHPVSPDELPLAQRNVDDRLIGEIWATQQKTMRPPLWDELVKCATPPPGRAWDTLTAGVNASCWNAIKEPLGALPEGVSHRASLWNSIFYACGFAVVDATFSWEQFLPLHELWRTGNFPLLFDRDDDLLVLVAN